MSIWGHRDSEPPAEEAHESQAPAEAHETQAPAEAHDTQAAAEPDHQAEPEHQTGEPAPAFWRAQGEAPAPFGRAPASAPPPAYGYSPADSPAPADGDDAVVLEGEVVKDEAAGDQAVAEAGEPLVTEAGPPAAAGAQEPAVTAAQEPAAAEVVSPAGASPASPGGISPQRWSEILAAFVDDPRGSVTMAADAVDSAIDEFVNSVRAQQRALASSWHGTETDTEQLRVALRDYRRFWHQVRQLDLAGKTGH